MEHLKKELEKLFNQYCETAERIFYTEDEVRGLIFVISKESDHLVTNAVPLTDDKDQVAQIVQYLLRKTKAIAGIIVSESWMKQFSEGDRWDGTMPSRYLDRIEILQVGIFSKVFNKMKIWKIIRNKVKRLEPMDTNLDGVTIESRFFGDFFTVGA